MPDTRQTTLAVDLGGEQILLERVEAQEALGRPFMIFVDVISSLGEIELLPHLGKAAAVSVSDDNEFQRYFHGLVVEGELTQETPAGFHYRLTLRPWTYFLSHNRDYAIFQEKTAVDIIKQVFADAGAVDVQYKLTKTYAKRTYCVQYGESDFTFVSRLMEEEGIYYFFRHEADRHVMVVCDTPNAHVQGKPGNLTYNQGAASVAHADSAMRTQQARKFYMQSWHERAASGGEAKVTLRDFDFEKPQQPLEAINKAEKKQHPNDTREVYDYPGRFVVTTDGKQLGEAALQAYRAERLSYTGRSQASGLSCGTKLDLVGHPADRFNQSYLITRTVHSVATEHYRSGGAPGVHEINVTVEAIPATTPWRALQTTPRPIVHGLETAIITGPPGEEIYTDEYGRVKVRFHWDRSGSDDEKSTCFMRVSQTGGLGNIIMPRVGHEVLVDFLGGDPDRPLVIGRVFNATHMPVYTLPDNKTIALWRTKTYGDTGDYGGAMSLDTKAPGANELRFEDKGGHEEVFIHAERDMKSRVRHKESHHVGLDQEIKIGNNRNEEVLNNEKIKIGNNQEEDVGKDRTTTVGGNDDLDVKGKIKIKAGTTIEIEAGTSIELKVGSTTIKLDPANIKLATTMIDASGQAMVTVKAPMTTVKGDGMLTLKGGMTMIN